MADTSRDTAGEPDLGELPADLMQSYLGTRTPAVQGTVVMGRSNATWTVVQYDSNAPKTGDPGATSPSAAYELRRCIGEGGMGEVWEATQLSLGRLVAVKRVKASAIPEEHFDRAQWDFRQEAIMSARLEHPNIVPVHDYGFDEDGNALLAMKLVRGRRWGDIVIADYPLMQVPDFLGRHLPILVEMAQAVAFAHSRGVVHRDLKPSQVMVGEFGETLLMDWGLAMIYDSSALERASGPVALQSLPTHATASNPSGTVGFMAPEQTRRSADAIGPWTDVYLLGATLYYLLTGQMPHSAEDSKRAFHKAMLGIIVPIEDAADGRPVPHELADIAMEAMQADPHKRISSAREFVRRVQDYLTGSTRRRGSESLVNLLTSEMEAGPRNYDELNAILDGVAKARDMWPENPGLHTLSDGVRETFAGVALEKGDLALARLHAQAIGDGGRRGRRLAQVDTAEEKRVSEARQRRRMLATILVLLVAGAAGLAVFLAQAKSRNLELAEEKRLAEEARHLAEVQGGRALDRAGKNAELAEFMLDELRKNLNLSVPRDQKIRDSVAKQVLDYFAKTDVRDDTREVKLRHAKNMIRVAELLTDLSMFDESERLASQARIIQEANLPATDAELGDSYYALGEVAMNRAQYEKAFELIRKSADLYRNDTSGGHARQLSVSLTDLAGILEEQGKYEEAEKIFTELIKTDVGSERISPQGQVFALNNYAHLLGSMKRPQEAEETFKQALALGRRILPEDDEALATVLGNLGQLYSDAGMMKDAEPLLRESFRINEKSWGPDHPDVAVSCNNLALVLEATGRGDEAEALFKRALAIDERTSGSKHPLIAIRLNNLASLYEHQGKLKLAEPLYLRAVEIFDTDELRESPEAIVPVANLGYFYVNSGKLKEGLPHLERALALMDKYYPADNPQLAEMRKTLGTLRLALKAKPTG